MSEEAMSSEGMPSSSPSPESSSEPLASPESSESSQPINEGNNLGVPDASLSDSSEPQASGDPDGEREDIPVAAQQEELQVPKKFTLKIDGEEQEFEESEVIKRAQLYSAADKRFQEASQVKKQNELLINTLREHPLEALLKIHGADKVRQITEEYLYQQLQFEQMSPEQRELQELRQFREAKQAEEQAMRAEQEKRQREEAAQKMQEQYKAEYTNMINKALNESGLPKTEDTLNRIVSKLQQNLENKIDVPIEMVVEQVKQEMVAAAQKFYGALEGPALLKMLGPDFLKKIRQVDFSQAKESEPKVPSKPAETPLNHSPRRAEKRYISMDEAKAEIERKLNS